MEKKESTTNNNRTTNGERDQPTTNPKQPAVKPKPHTTTDENTKVQKNSNKQHQLRATAVAFNGTTFSSDVTGGGRGQIDKATVKKTKKNRHKKKKSSDPDAVTDTTNINTTTTMDNVDNRASSSSNTATDDVDGGGVKKKKKKRHNKKKSSEPDTATDTTNINTSTTIDNVDNRASSSSNTTTDVDGGGVKKKKKRHNKKKNSDRDVASDTTNTSTNMDNVDNRATLSSNAATDVDGGSGSGRGGGTSHRNNKTARGGRGGSNNTGDGGRGRGGRCNQNQNATRKRSDGRGNDKNSNNNGGRGKGGGSNDNNNNNRNRPNRRSKIHYPNYFTHRECLDRISADDSKLVRGRIRVQPGGSAAFISCDRGRYGRDIFLKDEMARNRGLSGDEVFVEIIGVTDEHGDGEAGGVVVNSDGKEVKGGKKFTLNDLMGRLDMKGKKEVKEVKKVKQPVVIVEDTSNNVIQIECAADDQYATDVQYDDYTIPNALLKHDEDEDEVEDEDENEDDGEDDNSAGNNDGASEDLESIESDLEGKMWQDDQVQKSLWDPLVNIRRPNTSTKPNSLKEEPQYIGTVVLVVPPKLSPSEINPSSKRHTNAAPRKTIVGTLKDMPGANNQRLIFTPTNRCLPQFMTPPGTKAKLAQDRSTGNDNINNNSDGTNSTKSPPNPDTNLYSAEYIYGTWSSTEKWPPCSNLQQIGQSGNVEDETKALMLQFDVDHGPFPATVLQDVNDVVESGRTQAPNGEMGWSPTPAMIEGRRDYRKERIFTIDPTTAKDLDDALHVRELDNGMVEMGVHIADVSYFIKPGGSIDEEARRRGTTVYLVDRVVPMLPRPLCEIACSLNENVERLAFSCVWVMNRDGTLGDDGSKTGLEKPKNIWYGRTVIKSCARLDYATAQNIIDRKVAKGGASIDKEEDEALWPVSRRPTGGHTMEEVAKDVRLMHVVAMARRKLRFEHGALSLNGIKLSFQLEDDGETPSLCAPYPMRESNWLIEEYMLMANYLVAQRMITHAGGLALLRMHPPPAKAGLDKVVDISKASAGFDIDGTTSESLQSSLSKLGRECTDTLALQCVTAMLMTPMKSAEYIAAGSCKPEGWCHFALHIPYYTHFTSPIRRYPDMIVHRLLQATLDGEDAVKKFVHPESEIREISNHCNTKKDSSRLAQERSDIVFLSIFLKTNPIPSALAVITSVGRTTFTVFIPSLGLNTKIFMDDHKDRYNMTVNERPHGQSTMILYPKVDIGGPSKLDIKIMEKIAVACICKEAPPINVALRIVGPWVGET